GWKPLSRVLDRATVALCAEMCGGAQKVLEMTVEYAKIRQAFGRPIGSYQGVKHKAADMLVDVENSKSITYYAAWAMDEGVPAGSPAPAFSSTVASGSPGSTTCTSTSSGPRGRNSPSATPRGIASGWPSWSTSSLQAADKGSSASLAPSAAGSTYRSTPRPQPSGAASHMDPSRRPAG
ncbi:MAG: acyl-CoA dehydrogenase, partial [Candidatus Rokubacteria bacterium]|nr:acyl-CoA dehydrogenase [Candidatus Rokubacteria bacterium]